jgi:signal transduction histidine kinase
VTLQIADHGRGIPRGGIESGNGKVLIGVGIAGMRERVRQLRGSLEIESDANGTVIRVILPSAGIESVGEPDSQPAT